MTGAALPPAALGTGALAAYGVLALPLASAALPVYVHLPNLYGGALGMNLALLGAILLTARLADALIDPLLGALNDRLQRPRLAIAVGMLLLTAGVLMAFNPPRDGASLGAWSGASPATWLAAALVPLYLGYSMVSVSYVAWGALLGASPHERTRVTTWREGFGIAGVILASVLPQALAPDAAGGLARFSAVLVPVAVLALLALLAAAPRPAAPAHRPPVAWRAMLAPLSNPRFRRLFAVFVLNGIASALPATLVLFFVADVLQAPQSAGLFLALYFAAGAASLPLWLALSRRIGKAAAWFASMLLATLAFSGAFLLGAGDIAGFAAICALSGLALGADLALPPAMLADTVRAAGEESRAGAYAGLWTFATKLNLALAAGLALPLLALSGYVPGDPATVRPLAYAYGPLACVFKVIAAYALWPACRLRPNPEGVRT